MKKERVREALTLTQRLLEDFYQRNTDTVLGLCADDMSWIGAQAEQYDLGLEAFRADILAVAAEMVPCRLLHQEFHVAQNQGSTCTIIGRYQVVADESTGSLIAGQQRCTAVWELIESQLKLKHLSTTSPLDVWSVAEGERFPGSLGRLNREYVNRFLARESHGKRIVVDGLDGAVHFIPLHQIQWAEADGRNCVIHLSDARIPVRISISEFMEQTDDSFLQTHRSFVINMRFVRALQAGVVLMADGARLSVPEKRHGEVKRRLNEYFDAYNPSSKDGSQ